MRAGVIAGLVVVVLGSTGAASHAQAVNGPTLPGSDLQDLLALTGAQTPAEVPTQDVEPALAPVPAAQCDTASKPLAGEQGRVPQQALDSAQASRGWTCNLSVASHFQTPGGFRVWRYVDRQGHACAYYDTSLFTPANIISLAAGPSQGVVVLDMSDPAHPRQTDLLTAPGMISPHESLNLNAPRGLLAAETGTAASAPGVVSTYSVAEDCRRPVLQSDFPAGPFGHESGFSPDGRTFWIGGGQGIIAVDLTDPKLPHDILTLNEFAHGLNLSDDGDTLYDTDAIDGGLAMLDVSQVQSRKPDPQVREISRLVWQTTSIPQNTNPVTIDGHHYLLEYDEFAFRFNPATVDDKAGAARLIDVDDPAHPRVTSNLRLDVNMQANHRAADADPSFAPSSALSYGAHYCNVPREVDPEIAACSFLNSGLRIFDIRDPAHPREVAYFVAPTKTAQGSNANAAFAQPAFDPARREVYYSDAVSGFWDVKLDDAVWPHPLAAPAAAPCASVRSVTIRVRRPRRGRIVGVRARIAGGSVLKLRRVRGRYVTVVRLSGRPRGAVHVLIRVRTSRHTTYSDSRTYHPCQPGAH